MRITVLISMMICAGFSLMGCNATVEDFCEDRAPQLKHEIEMAWRNLGKPAYYGRSLASLSALPRAGKETVVQLKKDQFNEDESSQWLKWGEWRLKEVQRYMDILAVYPEHAKSRKMLSDIADDILNFYGFVVKEDKSKMRLYLERIDLRTRNVIQNVCHGKRHAKTAAKAI